MKKEPYFLFKLLLEYKNKPNDKIEISDCLKNRQLPAELKYLSLESTQLKKLNFSLLFLKPKRHFFVWLQNVLELKKLKINQIYFPEEDGVWLIPSSFHSDEHFEAFIQCLKPIMLKRELGQFGPGKLMPSNISPETFDEFFEIHIRDKVTNSLDFFKVR